MVIALTLGSQPRPLITGADPHAQPGSPGVLPGLSGHVAVPWGPENQRGRAEG